MKLTINENVIVDDFADYTIITKIKDSEIDFSKATILEDTAKFIFKLIQKDKTFDEIVNVITNEYGIPEQVAKKDLEKFISKLKEKGILND